MTYVINHICEPRNMECQEDGSCEATVVARVAGKKGEKKTTLG